MVISADFEKQKQYFDKKILHYRFIAISLYRNIACQNRSSDEGLIVEFVNLVARQEELQLTRRQE
jgi:hypothetical protein